MEWVSSFCNEDLETHTSLFVRDKDNACAGNPTKSSRGRSPWRSYDSSITDKISPFSRNDKEEVEMKYKQD